MREATTHVVRVHVHVYTYHTSCVCSFPSSTLAEGLYAVHREKLLRIEFLKIALPVSNSLHLSLAVSQHEKTANFSGWPRALGGSGARLEPFRATASPKALTKP